MVLLADTKDGIEDRLMNTRSLGSNLIEYALPLAILLSGATVLLSTTGIPVSIINMFAQSSFGNVTQGSNRSATAGGGQGFNITVSSMGTSLNANAVETAGIQGLVVRNGEISVGNSSVQTFDDPEFGPNTSTNNNNNIDLDP